MAKRYLSMDPNAGDAPAGKRYLSTDPNATEDVPEAVPVAPPQGRPGVMGGVMDFAGGVWDTTAQPMLDTAGALAKSTIRDPAHAGWDVLADMFFGAQKASEEQFKKALDIGQGKTLGTMTAAERLEQSGRAAAGFFPMIGPAAAQAGEKLGTPGQRARGAGEATGLIGGALLPEATRKVAPVVPKAARGAVEAGKSFHQAHPMIVETALDMIPGYGRARSTAKIVEALETLRKAGAEARPVDPPTAPQAPPAAPRRVTVPIPEPGKVKMATIHQPEGSFTMNTAEGRASEAAAKGTPENLSLAEKQQGLIGSEVENPLIDSRAKPLPDRGKAAVLAHGEVMQAAKAAVKADSTYGEKVWLALDDSGKPAGTFKSEPAARAAAKKIGGKVSWAKNLWSEAKDFQ